MPEITGLKLAEELLQHRPGLPIILASGYTGALNQANARELGVSAFLSKPFELETLAQTVRRVLDGAN